MKLIYLILAILLVSCADEKNDDPKSKEPSKTGQEFSDTTKIDLVSRIPGGEENENGGKDKQKVQNSLDSIKMTIGWWNNAININAVIALHNLYDDEVQFYREKVQKPDLVQSKRTWLNEHPDYSQEIKIREIQYPSEAKGTIRCLFIKEYKDGNELKKVNSILELKLIDGRYLITKESDVPTEISLIKDEIAQDLDTGELFFQHDYWLDTRDSEVLGHDFVPYYMGVTISNGETLKVELDSYSGSLREHRDYVTKEAVFKDGFLSFKAGPLYERFGGEEDIEAIKEEDYQYFKFKVLNKNIALVATDGWFEELVGTRFW